MPTSLDERGSDDSESLGDLVRSYLDDPEIDLTPDRPDLEARANTWAYGVAGPVNVEDVVTALEHVAATLRERFAHGGPVATFYAWYDERAGQLRCSLRSVTPDQLPFSGAHHIVDDAAEVVQRAAEDPHPDTILWEELTESIEIEPAEDQANPFPVWAQLIG